MQNFFVHELIHCRPENWLKVNSVVSLKRREILHVLLFDFIVIDLIVLFLLKGERFYMCFYLILLL